VKLCVAVVKKAAKVAVSKQTHVSTVDQQQREPTKHGRLLCAWNRLRSGRESSCRRMLLLAWWGRRSGRSGVSATGPCRATRRTSKAPTLAKQVARVYRTDWGAGANCGNGKCTCRRDTV